MASCPWWGEEIQPVVATRDHSSGLWTSFRHSVVSDSLWSHGPHTHSTPDFPVLHHLPEFVQTHVHWVSDAIQPCHPLSSPSPPAFSLSQHQGLFQWPMDLLFHQEEETNLEFDEKPHPMGHSAQGLWFNAVDMLACYLPAGHVMEHRDSECRMPRAVSVSKGCCGYQAISHCSRPGRLALRGVRKEENRNLALHSYAAYHTKGGIPVSPNSCMLPYMEKHYSR